MSDAQPLWERHVPCRFYRIRGRRHRQLRPPNSGQRGFVSPMEGGLVGVRFATSGGPGRGEAGLRRTPGGPRGGRRRDGAALAIFAPAPPRRRVRYARGRRRALRPGRARAVRGVPDGSPRRQGRARAEPEHPRGERTGRSRGEETGGAGREARPAERAASDASGRRLDERAGPGVAPAGRSRQKGRPRAVLGCAGLPGSGERLGVGGCQGGGPAAVLHARARRGHKI
mmetsp:Transcript_17550/g.50103  ORF Transcript_17550/g.50103 Transcript_17550/m.50103 type:complete len:228 (-) Transcript_17550:703-1386(-)